MAFRVCAISGIRVRSEDSHSDKEGAGLTLSAPVLLSEGFRLIGWPWAEPDQLEARKARRQSHCGLVTAVGWGKPRACSVAQPPGDGHVGWGRRGASQEYGAPAGPASLLVAGCCGTALRVGAETHLRCGLWFPC